MQTHYPGFYSDDTVFYAIVVSSGHGWDSDLTHVTILKDFTDEDKAKVFAYDYQREHGETVLIVNQGKPFNV